MSELKIIRPSFGTRSTQSHIKEYETKWLVSLGSLSTNTSGLILVINDKPYLMTELIVTDNICFKFFSLKDAMDEEPEISVEREFKIVLIIHKPVDLSNGR